MIDPNELRNRISRQSSIILSNFIDSDMSISKAKETASKYSDGEVATDKKALAIASSEAEAHSK